MLVLLPPLRHFVVPYNVTCVGLVSVVSVETTIGDKIVETLYSNRVALENKRIHTPPLSPQLKVGAFVVFYR